jgi:hypothetical protein
MGSYRRKRILDGELDPFPDKPLKNLKSSPTVSGTSFVSEFKRKKWKDYGGIRTREFRGEPTGPRGQKGVVGDIKLISQPQGLLFALQIRPGFYSESWHTVSIDIGTPYTYFHYSDVLSSDPSRTKQATADQLSIWDQFWHSLQMLGWDYLGDVGLHWYSKRLFRPLNFESYNRNGNDD